MSFFFSFFKSSQFQEGDALRKEVSTLSEANVALKVQLDEAKRSLTQITAQAASKERQLEEALHQHQERLSVLSKQSASADESLAQAGKAMSSQLEKLAAELEHTRRENEELRRSQQQMEASLTNMIVQERKLRSENDEQMEFIAQARNTIAQLRSERECIFVCPFVVSFSWFASQGMRNQMEEKTHCWLSWRVKWTARSRLKRRSKSLLPIPPLKGHLIIVKNTF